MLGVLSVFKRKYWFSFSHHHSLLPMSWHFHFLHLDWPEYTQTILHCIILGNNEEDRSIPILHLNWCWSLSNDFPTKKSFSPASKLGVKLTVFCRINIVIAERKKPHRYSEDPALSIFQASVYILKSKGIFLNTRDLANHWSLYSTAHIPMVTMTRVHSNITEWISKHCAQINSLVDHGKTQTGRISRLDIISS